MPLMEILLSAVLSELTTRSINFFISRSSKPWALDVEDRLRRVLLRAQVIIDEAMGRHVTNQAMLHQLDMLRDAMHRGYYMLDTFRYQSLDKEDAKAQDVSHSLSLSKVSSLKGLCSSSRNAQILEQLQKSLDDLSSMILDVGELVVFLTSCPRLYRQPYSMHLVLGNCMFGRQMEAELVISFLLHTRPRSAEDLEVLPIVGPRRVGKSTLVAHVCKDERVRDHFSEIMFLNNHDLRDEKLATLREGCAKKYQNCTLNKGERMLVVVEAAGDFNEGAWRRLYSASKRCLTSGSKIIITSRSDKITKLGTTQAVTLKYLSNEACWYVFKTLTFGSTDPAMHPRLAYLAMEIARMLNGVPNGAISTSYLLRENFDIHFWCKLLAFLRGFTKWHVSRFGEHPSNPLNQNRPVHVRRMATPFEEIVIYHQYERSSQEEVPKIRIQDVMYGSVKPHGKFEALGWRSQIPPYYSYVYTCEIRELKSTAAKRKRSMKNGVTLC
ncbi:putative disease resistance RPP13-like protein 1 [Phragmites australis]|uniref:putative disease resistance RPP13-like protein 1 n=1 Tax=Phragmites australis TaxID=29695 RepID=UPI002D78D297|nr:putative disease resistance RPP13-like protein 1 [Phragmites australis]